MGLLDGLKKALGRSPGQRTAPETPSQARNAEPPIEEVRVPEVTSSDLMAELSNGAAGRPVLLDCREPFERAQAFIPDSVHIPMNTIPYRLEELDPSQEVVVYCAHGNRSYGVAGWLIQQGYKARSLKGGIVDWQHKHGPVETSYRGRS